ncbi:unnamed protein product [Arabis nemorensis]|uniref:ditrans,polycis-polyprenyl diphosphate synthase [(2E,6E)-farnesyldiphosphate specific] n=1 Tax=Arabis nemorensis TaxID=586526 RepID=A0A565AY22_9BRAS|nr:unnamed protein product [Arabis nemorensis]
MTVGGTKILLSYFNIDRKQVLESSDLCKCLFSQTGDLVLYFLWRLMHILVSVWYIVLDRDEKLERGLMSLGVKNHYSPIDVGKIRNLAIVMEPKYGYELMNVVELIQWLRTIGVKHAYLFDSEGSVMHLKVSGYHIV